MESLKKKNELGFNHHEAKEEFEPKRFVDNTLLDEIRNNPDKLDIHSKDYFDKTNTKLFPKNKP